jgi:uncharacterized membrane protein
MNDATQVVIAIVIGIAFLGVVSIALTVVAMRLFSRSGSLEILDQRYAKGEIDAAQYDEMRTRLQRTS